MTAYSRKKAHRNYLKLAKQRETKAKAMRKAVGEQLGYLAIDMETLENLLKAVGYDRLTGTDQERLAAIRKVYRQQKQCMIPAGTNTPTAS